MAMDINVYLNIHALSQATVTVPDAQLATAPTNGSVVLWDINRRTKSKLGKFAIQCTSCCVIP